MENKSKKMEKKHIDYTKETVSARRFDAKLAIQQYYLTMFPSFIRIPLTFLLN
jgi:hypothetical protein